MFAHDVWVLDARGRTQLGQQRDREMEDALDVGAQHLLPAGCWELLERCAPGGAGVVDEDVERGEALSRGGGESLGALLSGYVCGDRVAVT
jgi:hypothetical protein